MTVFKINCRNTKLNSEFSLDKLFSTRDKAHSYIKELEDIPSKWGFVYEVEGVDVE